MKVLSRFHRFDMQRLTNEDFNELYYFRNPDPQQARSWKFALFHEGDEHESLQKMQELSRTMKSSTHALEVSRLGEKLDDGTDARKLRESRVMADLGQETVENFKGGLHKDCDVEPKSQLEVWNALSKATIKDRKISFSRSEMLDVQEVALRMGMSTDDVVLARTVFDGYDFDNSGTINMEELESVVLQLMSLQLPKQAVPLAHVKGVCRDYFAKHDRSGIGDVELDFNQFAGMYSNMLSEDFLISESQRIMNIALDHGMEPEYVQSLKESFDAFCNDVGVLDIDGFNEGLHKAMRAPPGSQLPWSRIKRFWCSLDPKSSGGIVFEQFLRFFLHNFYVHERNALSDEMPFETFYKLVRPAHYRCSSPAVMGVPLADEEDSEDNLPEHDVETEPLPEIIVKTPSVQVSLVNKQRSASKNISCVRALSPRSCGWRSTKHTPYLEIPDLDELDEVDEFDRLDNQDWIWKRLTSSWTVAAE
jgi:Ca2+-binding EF-hand superfamily protein